MIAAAGGDSGKVRLEVVQGDQGDKGSKGGRRRPSDDEWDAMGGDAQRRSVRQMVQEELAAIDREADFAELRSEVERLRAGATKQPPGQKPPTMWDKLQAAIWGSPPR